MKVTGFLNNNLGNSKFKNNNLGRKIKYIICLKKKKLNEISLEYNYLRSLIISRSDGYVKAFCIGNSTSE